MVKALGFIFSRMSESDVILEQVWKATGDFETANILDTGFKSAFDILCYVNQQSPTRFSTLIIINKVFYRMSLVTDGIYFCAYVIRVPMCKVIGAWNATPKVYGVRTQMGNADMYEC